MFGLGVSEIVIITVAIMILLFGSKKVVEIARSLGRVGGEYKKGQREIEAELKASEQPESEAGQKPVESTESVTTEKK